MFNLSFNNTVLRFYFMMLLAIFAVFLHQSWLILVVYAVGVSAILGYRVKKPHRKKREAKRIGLRPQPRERRKAG